MQPERRAEGLGQITNEALLQFVVTPNMPVFVHNYCKSGTFTVFTISCHRHI